MKKNKLIAVDIDGTLLDDTKGLPDANREALQEASSRGMIVAIASGRMTPRIEPIEDLLGIDQRTAADEAQHAVVEDPGRDVMQRVAHSAEDHRVAGVRPALVARHDGEVRREEVDDLPLPLVAPLGPDDRHVRHACSLPAGP